MNIKMKVRIFFLFAFFLPGALSVGYSTILITNTVRLASEGTRSTGIISKYERQENMRRVGRRFCPVVEFSHDGRVHQFTDDWCNKSQKQHPPGSTVNVIFKTSNPANARIDEFMALYGRSLFIGVIGVPFLLLGIVLFFRVR